MTAHTIHEEPLFPHLHIQERLKAVAQGIDQWLAEEETTDVVATCILRGAVYFYADLTRALSHSVELSFCSATSYSTENNAALPTCMVNFVQKTVVTGRRVLVVDDICDSGRTLQAVTKHLLDEGATEVRTVVLIRRHIKAPLLDPHYVCFEHQGPEWFVGYGLDDANRRSNLADVYRCKA